IQEALIDRPNVVVVLDDVVQKETVKFANQLGLRVLATTRNAELFAGATCSVDLIHVGGVTAEESKQLFSMEEASPEIWALVVPVDVVDADESEFLMLLSDRLKRLCDNGDWLSHNKQSDTFSFSRMVEIYLRETVEAPTVK
ncbi:hypothetical protein ANCCEY_15681, partial [Ancylostoma ceylanicum]